MDHAAHPDLTPRGRALRLAEKVFWITGIRLELNKPALRFLDRLLAMQHRGETSSTDKRFLSAGEVADWLGEFMTFQYGLTWPQRATTAYGMGSQSAATDQTQVNASRFPGLEIDGVLAEPERWVVETFEEGGSLFRRILAFERSCRVVAASEGNGRFDTNLDELGLPETGRMNKFAPYEVSEPWLFGPEASSLIPDLRKRSNRGDVEAWFLLAFLLRCEAMNPARVDAMEEALHWYRTAAAAGHPRASYLLAQFYGFVGIHLPIRESFDDTRDASFSSFPGWNHSRIGEVLPLLREASDKGLPRGYLLLNPYLREAVGEFEDWNELERMEGLLIPAIANQIGVREIFRQEPRPYVILSNLNSAISRGDVAALRNGWTLLHGSQWHLGKEYLWDEPQIGLAYSGLDRECYLIEERQGIQDRNSPAGRALETYREELSRMLKREDTHAERLRHLCLARGGNGGRQYFSLGDG